MSLCAPFLAFDPASWQNCFFRTCSSQFECREVRRHCEGIIYPSWIPSFKFFPGDSALGSSSWKSVGVVRSSEKTRLKGNSFRLQSLNHFIFSIFFWKSWRFPGRQLHFAALRRWLLYGTVSAEGLGSGLHRCWHVGLVLDGSGWETSGKICWKKSQDFRGLEMRMKWAETILHQSCSLLVILSWTRTVLARARNSVATGLLLPSFLPSMKRANVTEQYVSLYEMASLSQEWIVLEAYGCDRAIQFQRRWVDFACPLFGEAQKGKHFGDFAEVEWPIFDKIRRVAIHLECGARDHHQGEGWSFGPRRSHSPGKGDEDWELWCWTSIQSNSTFRYQLQQEPKPGRVADSFFAIHLHHASSVFHQQWRDSACRWITWRHIWETFRALSKPRLPWSLAISLFICTKLFVLRCVFL